MSDTRIASEKETVPLEFDRVARSYDLLSALNPGYSSHLRRSAARMKLQPGARILDLCCGTGLSTAQVRAVYPEGRITGLDASAGMLEQAREKAELSGIDFVHGDAMDPAASGVEGPFDGILMAYGIRNVPQPDLCLERLKGLLAPGGTICLHEYSVRGSLWATGMWNFVTLGIVIPLGLVFAGTTKIFRYLRRSVLDFDSVAELEARLTKAGFENVRTEPMGGWQRGVVHSFLAEAPDG